VCDVFARNTLGSVFLVKLSGLFISARKLSRRFNIIGNLKSGAFYYYQYLIKKILADVL
jgi:hypothetical protein